MRPYLAPGLAVALLAALVGCGGSGGDGVVDTTTTGTTGTGGTTGTTGSTPVYRAAAGSYTVAFTGGDDAAAPTSYTGTGTATVASDGTVTIADLAATATGATTGTATRKVTAAVTAAGVVSGSLVVGTATAVPIAGTAAYSANGTYGLTFTAPSGTAFETDRLTLTALLPASGTYKGTSTGTDNRGGTYAGSPTATLGGTGALTASYTLTYRAGTARIGQPHALELALAADGSLTGTLTIGAGTAANQTSVTGTYTLASGTLTLTAKYTNVGVATASGYPTVTETLVLKKA